MSEQRADRPADPAEVARMLGAVVEVVDQGEVESPRWLRDRIKSAAVTASALAGQSVPVSGDSARRCGHTRRSEPPS